MSDKLLKATHQGLLPIADKEMACAVLEDGTRIISRSAIFRAFGRTKRGRKKDEVRVLNMPAFIDANNLQPFINKDLREELRSIEYVNLNGRVMTGYNAEILPHICDVYLDARNQNVLTKQQLPLAVASEILVRGLSKIGIIALVDEATGYQEIRDRLALQKILEKYISRELLPWTKRFPDDFYKELFRLRGWQYNPLSVKRPKVVGNLTNNIVYDRIAPGVLKELKRITPKDDKGRHKHRFHQRLTPDIGHPKLYEHLSNVIVLMRASSNWSQFRRLMERSLPKIGDTRMLPFPEDDLQNA